MVAQPNYYRDSDTTPTGIGTAATYYLAGGDIGATELEFLCTLVKCYGGVVIVVSNKPSNFERDYLPYVARRYGKSSMVSRIVTKLYTNDFVIYEPRHRHDYPMLIKYFRGPVERGRSRTKPRIQRAASSKKDRKINKRKSYIKWLYSQSDNT